MSQDRSVDNVVCALRNFTCFHSQFLQTVSLEIVVTIQKNKCNVTNPQNVTFRTSFLLSYSNSNLTGFDALALISDDLTIRAEPPSTSREGVQTEALVSFVGDSYHCGTEEFYGVTISFEHFSLWYFDFARPRCTRCKRNHGNHFGKQYVVMNFA